MNATVEDLRPTIVPKSDQINSEQLLGGPMTITVSAVSLKSSPEQPVTIHYEGENGRPYKPCLTMRKLLVHAWGPNGLLWAGRSMTLYCDPEVKWAGEAVGGIRISHLTDIPNSLSVSLTSTRGKKAKYKIHKLTSHIAGQLADLRNSPGVESLKDNFAAAYRSTKDTAERAQLKAAYDARLAELQNTPDAPTKTLADYIDGIDNAADADAAQALVDEVADSLGAEDLDKLREAHAMAWGDK